MEDVNWSSMMAYPRNSYTDFFLDKIRDLFFQHVVEPTAVLATSCTLDLVFTNEPRMVRDITYFQVWKTAIIFAFAFPYDNMPTITTQEF